MTKSQAEAGNPAYTAALEVLDEDMPDYIHDNTDDEITHHQFLNAYLVSKGAAPANLDQFRTLTGSTATGVNQDLIGKRLTNLTQLTLDTSWWTRYRDDKHNPDLDPTFSFPQAVRDLSVNQHTAIPRTDADTSDPNFLQAIANTAGFHFPTIEQGGSSLYPSLAQRATDVQVLRILMSIGPTETMHFQTWSDKAGNAPPLSAVDPVTGVKVKFPDLAVEDELFDKSLIMPSHVRFWIEAFPLFRSSGRRTLKAWPTVRSNSCALSSNNIWTAGQYIVPVEGVQRNSSRKTGMALNGRMSQARTGTDLTIVSTVSRLHRMGCSGLLAQPAFSPSRK